MKTNFENQKVIHYFKKLSEHSFFDRSPRNIRLLCYLFDQAQKNVNVQEHTIGQDLFSNRFNIENNNGNVRVYMYNLRKKLKAYYNKHGVNDEVIFILEKGQYNLSYQFRDFEKNTSYIEKKEKKNRLKKSITLSILSFITIVSISFFTFRKSQYLWTDFFNSKNSNLCIVADHYMLQQNQSDNTTRAINIFGINSKEDLNTFKKQRKDEKLMDGGYTMLTSMALYATQSLSKLFWDQNIELDFKLESQFQFSDTRDQNFIYIGQRKTMNTSKSFFLKDSDAFEFYGSGYTYKNNLVEKKYTPKVDLLNITEYTMVSFQKLENNKKAIFFVSDHDIGVIATVKSFTNNKWLSDFYKQNNIEEGDFFNALFEVKGLKRTEMGCKLLHIEIL